MNSNELLKLGLRLEDAISEVSSSLEKAESINDDLDQSYFNLRDCENPTQDDRAIIVAMYRDAGIKNSIVLDYLYEVGKRLERLQGMVNDFRKQMREGNT